MRGSANWNVIALILGIISMLVITYTSTLISNFKTPENTSNFLKNSNTYFYLAEIIKTNIRNNYPQELQNNIVKFAAANTLLNSVVSPEFIEQLAMPVLKVRNKIAELPLSYAENNLVLDTTGYTSQLPSTVAELDLPVALNDTAQQLIASIPTQITVVESQNTSNSIIANIARTKIFFENAQTILTISWIIFIVSILTLIYINIDQVRRLARSGVWLFAVSGIIILIFSFITPDIVNTLSPTSNLTTEVLRDKMVSDMIAYYFSLTRNISIVFLTISLILYLVYRRVQFSKVQKWIDERIRVS